MEDYVSRSESLCVCSCASVLLFLKHKFPLTNVNIAKNTDDMKKTDKLQVKFELKYF